MKRAFTLIELLVVVTIIAVLLALLVPAMDKAIYQAELAVCATKQRAISAGAIIYASNFKRWYPDRPSRRSNGSNRPCDLYWGRNKKMDDRLILKQFLDLNEALNCPLDKAIDIEGSDADSIVTSTYALYFGFGYEKIEGQGEKGMFKLGDRWTYTDMGDGSAPPAVTSFSVLASDWVGILLENNWNQSTHPDMDGVLEQFHCQDSDYRSGTGAVAAPPFKATLSVWRGKERGPIDANYAYDDGSVKRFNGVVWNEGDPALNDERRLIWVPMSDVNNTNAKLSVPGR